MLGHLTLDSRKRRPRAAVEDRDLGPQPTLDRLAETRQPRTASGQDDLVEPPWEVSLLMRIERARSTSATTLSIGSLRASRDAASISPSFRSRSSASSREMPSSFTSASPKRRVPIARSRVRTGVVCSIRLKFEISRPMLTRQKLPYPAWS